MRLLILFMALVLCMNRAIAQTSYTWNGAVSAAWNNAANWSPNGIPGNADNVTIVTGTNTCTLNANTGIANIKVSSSTLDLGGFTLTVAGSNATFTTGTVQNGMINVTGATTTVFGNGPMTMNCKVDVVSDAVSIRNTVFQNTTSISKTGAANDVSYGSNTFNGVTTITNSGAGYIRFANSGPDIFNNSVDFNNSGGGIYPAYNSSGNIFGGVTSLNNSPAANTGIYISWYSAGTSFQDNIIVSSTGGQGVQFCGGNATASVTLSAGKTIQAGGGGLTAGYLILKQFTQSGTVPVNLNATGSAVIYLGPSAKFGGPVSVTAPDIWAQGATYNDAAVFTKTGGSNNNNNQYQNIFNSTCTINQQSSTGYFMLGYNSNDLFNDNIILNSTGGSPIYLGWTSGTGTPTLSAGKTLQVGGAGFSAGFLNLNGFIQLGNAPVNLNFTGTATGLNIARGSVIGGDLTSNTGDLFLSNSTFNGNVNVSKTGPGNDASAGGNVFNGSTVVNNSGTGYLIFGNGSADIWNEDATFYSSGSSYIALGWNSAGNVFNGNITVSSTGSSTGITFCQNASSTVNVAAGKTIQTGPGGFSSGALVLKQFTQSGNAPVNLTLTGATTLIQTGPSTAIGGDFTIVSPRILLNGAVFSNPVSVTKTGATGEWSAGGNIFNSTLTVNQQGAGYFGFANGAPDIYNGDLYANNNSTERIIFGNNPAGNQFNGNIILTQTGASVGIAFGWSVNSDETLAAGKTISIGAAGFSTGYLQIKQFTQAGTAPVNLALTGNTALTIGPSSAFAGNFTSTSASLYLNGCTFNGTVNATKAGTTNDYSSGNNIFNGAAVITNAGSGNLLFGNGNSDQFNNDASFNNTGSANIYIAHSSVNNIFGGVTTLNNNPSANTAIYVSWYSAGTVFSDNLVVSSTNGQGVQFCGGNTGATATLSAGKTISIGAGGFSAGTLLLRQFFQTGATAQSITLTGTGNLTFGPAASFGGNITTLSPSLFFNGCKFDGTVNSVKNGPGNDGSTGNNNFNGTFSITNTGSGYFLMGNGNPDLWQSTAIFNNFSSGQNMYIAYNSTGNVFNGDVVFINQPASNNFLLYPNYYGINTQFNGNISVANVNGGGVSFGTGTGSATLAAGKTISVGAGGFNNGGLVFRNFTQTGLGTAQSLVTTGTSYIQYASGSSFDGPLTSASPGLFFNGSVFNGTVNCVKTGATNDQSQGNNTFNGPASFTNAGTGYLLMTAGNPDAYNNNVTFIQSNTGPVYPNYNGNSNYRGDLTVTSPSTISFGSNTGTATLSGTGLQNINTTAGTPTPVFTRLTIANTGAGVTLNNTSINVSKNLTLNSGLLNTSTSNILTMLNGSVTAAGDALSTSYVNGPMRYQKASGGSSILNFPIGNNPDCRPVSLTVNHTNGHLYTYQAQLFNSSAAALGYTLPPTVDIVSGVHYYTISRTDASSVNQPTLELSGNQTIEIFFGSNDVVVNGGTLTIVKNKYTALTNWIDIGGTGGPIYNGGASLSGSISSTSSPSAFNSFSTFALADKYGGANILPVGLLYFNAKPDHDQVALTWATAAETNNSYFSVEKSKDGQQFALAQNINSAAPGGNSSISINYATADLHPYAGLSYYRLKQTDLNGGYIYSPIVPVNFEKKPAVFIYPNPTAGKIYISGINESSLRIEWYDMSGRNLLQQTVPVQNGIVIINPAFKAGVYVLRYITADGNATAQNIIIGK